MPIKIIGRSSKVPRLITNLYSLDRALVNAQGEIGFPMRALIELYGYTHVGKSTLAYSLSGLFASKHFQSNIALADVEGLDVDYLEMVMDNAGFSGDIFVIEEENDEKMLNELTDLLQKDDYAVGILDTVGSISPISELSGKLGSANMGRRARLMAQFSRKANHIMLSKDIVIFANNHIHPLLGTVPGTTTPGGNTLKNLAHVRISIKQTDTWPPKTPTPLGYCLEGRITKNRFGGKGRIFKLAMVSGRGVHPGMTALVDGVDLGIVERSTTVKIADKSIGYMKHLIRDAYMGNDDVFDPFLEAIHEFERSNSNQVQREEAEVLPEVLPIEG